MESNIETFGASHLLNINSRDRVSGTTSNFRVSFQSNSHLHKVRRVVLKSAQFANVIYNINEHNNSAKWIFSVSGAQAIAIPVGQYSLSTFIAAVENAVNAAIAPNTVAITFDTLTYKLNFVFTGETVDIEAGTEDSLNRPLGILEDITAGSTFDGSSTVALYGLRLARLKIDRLQNNLFNSDGTNAPVLTEIPVTAPFGGLNLYQTPDTELTSKNFDYDLDLSHLTISLTDEHDNPLDLQGRELDLWLKVYHWT